ncbi:unnamed protein product [Clavelina lepadiformis]|uniref:SEFIR domain-containing protein n=1 Tax=Clavelina lepadiformis TaxID=159417 RepID=A0ABP0H0H7_CLALP
MAQKDIEGQSIPPPKKTFKQCDVEVIRNPPYPTKNEIPAPSPKWQNILLYPYKTSDGKCSVAWNLTWSQDGKEIHKYVTGYYLTIRSGPFVTVRRKFSFETTFNNGTILFNYACYGWDDNEEIQPNEGYVFTLLALPINHIKGYPSGSQQIATVPDCRNQLLQNTCYCINNSERDMYKYYDDEDNGESGSADPEIRNTPPSSDTETKPFGVIVIVVIIVLFLLLSIFIVIVWIKQRQRSDCGSKSVLMLVFQAEKSTLHFDISSRIASMLKKYGELEVSFNLWSMSEMEDTFQWFDDNKRCDHIVLVCTPEGKKNCDRPTQDASNDPFMIGLNQFKKEIQRTLWWQSNPKTHSFSCIYFERNPESSIPNIIELYKSNVAFYNLRKDFDKFFYKLTGKHKTAIPEAQLHYIYNTCSKLEFCNNDRNIAHLCKS